MRLPGDDTIVAAATPAGSGALGIIRISGPDAFSIVGSVWKGASIAEAATHTAHLGYIIDEKGEILDQAVATVFRGPKSFTGEDSVELSLHGSAWIMREVTLLLLRKGARGAEPGEFSRRAYMNGRMDLASAEGVADLIASSSRAAHRLAMSQTRGAFSKEFNSLRDRLIELASLLELELDFSEEDVEFADRSRLMDTTRLLLAKIDRLTDSYSAGRAFKEGVPVVIAGVPNVGKSTLLNALLQEEKAIVSDIPGTTRDIIEDTCEIEGVLFRFIDTAGLRDSSDTVESIGIERARQRLAKASIVLWLIDPHMPSEPQLKELRDILPQLEPHQKLIAAITKTALPETDSDTLALTESAICDLSMNQSRSIADSTNHIDSSRREEISGNEQQIEVIRISAAEEKGLDTLRKALKSAATEDYNPDSEMLLTNARHYSDMLKAGQALRRAIDGMQAGLSADFIAMDIREATAALSSLTGAITTPDLLNSIFTHFCIGK